MPVQERPTTLQERPGYKLFTVPEGPQAGRHVLRRAWLSRADLRQLAKAGKLYDIEKEETQALHMTLSRLVVEWDLVDPEGNPLPQPAEGVVAWEALDPFTDIWIAGFEEGSLFADVAPKKVLSARS